MHIKDQLLFSQECQGWQHNYWFIHLGNTNSTAQCNNNHFKINYTRAPINWTNKVFWRAMLHSSLWGKYFALPWRSINTYSVSTRNQIFTRQQLSGWVAGFENDPKQQRSGKKKEKRESSKLPSQDPDWVTARLFPSHWCVASVSKIQIAH